jgi:flagellar basal-body rod protein FlgB
LSSSISDQKNGQNRRFLSGGEWLPLCLQGLAGLRIYIRKIPQIHAGRTVWHGACCFLVRKENGMTDRLFGIHGAALELRSQRMGVLTSNIANAATPGYKARDIDFAAALEARVGGQSAQDAVQTGTRFRVPTMPSLDGNTVELANEQIAFAENALAYSATLSFVQGHADKLTRALRGE